MYYLLVCREPNQVEQSACLKLLDTMRTRYQNRREQALELLSIGDAERDSALDPVEHAAWTQVATTVLASDAVIMLY